MIPQLPTDNLYKFATLGGIALLVFCSWSLRDTAVQMDRGVSNYNQVVNELDSFLAGLDDESNKLTADVERVQGLLADAQMPDNQIDLTKAATALEAFKKLEEATDAANSKRSEARRAKATVDTRSADLESLLDRLSREVDQIYWLWLTGALITALGVSCWYFKHQKYQDELLRVQLENARRATAIPQNAPAMSDPAENAIPHQLPS